MLNSATILVVDDDPSIGSTIARILEPEFKVVTAVTGVEALERIAEEVPDVILLDIIMPGLDGYALCEHLRRDLVTANLPVIFVTEIREAEAESDAFESGASDFISKPFSPIVLRARVRNHVELKQARDRLLSLAQTDSLTALFNRRAFDITLEREFRRLTRVTAPLSLIMIDVDRFKAFNDIYGHVSGDDCLRQIAGILTAELHRSADFVARYGGEEFVCILPDITLEAAVVVAERIRLGIRDLQIPHSGSTVALIVTASLGIASQICSQKLKAEDILRSADRNLYAAKAAGRDRVVA